MSTGFVHLCVHSEYSLVDGLVRVNPLVRAVADRGMPAIQTVLNIAKLHC